MIEKKKIAMLSSLCCFTLVSSFVYALPQEVTVMHGNVGVSTENANMVITASDGAVLHHASFNIAENESVQFVQPSTSSVVLNRVVGNDPSSILGKMTSNGHVFLVNPNGVYFGPDAKVDVGSLIVSTMDIANQDFVDGRYQFTANGSQGAINHFGAVQASDGGVVAFISPFINNQGSITVPDGKVEFVSGEKVTVDFSGDGMVSFAVEGQLAQASIQQGGQLSAYAVKMTASAAEEVLSRGVNMTGVNEGTQMISYNGEIHITNDSMITANQIDIAADSGSKVSLDGCFELSDSGSALTVSGATVAVNHFDVISDQGSGTIELSAIGLNGDITFAEGTRLSTPANYTLTFATQNGGAVHLSDRVEVSPLGKSLTFNAPVVLDGDQIFIHTNASGNKISFNDKVIGSAAESNLFINAGRGSVSFAKTVGEKVAIGKLDLKAGSLSLPEKVVTRGQDMTIAACTLFNQDTVLDSTGQGKYADGNVSFVGKRSSIDGDFRLLVDAGKGETQFEGIVGGKSSMQRFHLKSAKTTLKNT